MNCLVIAYLTSASLIEDIESIMEYQSFKIIESNINYRVFAGSLAGNHLTLVTRLNNGLKDAEFDIEDSIFLVRPIINDHDYPKILNIVIKRKGNRQLRSMIYKK
jgi:hypothetical protein